MIKNYIERLRFKYSKIPTWQEAVKRIPDGSLRKYYSKDITLGNLEWKKGWTKNYNEDKDPLFVPWRPWNSELSSIDNIKHEGKLLTLTQHKEPNSKDAYMESNFTIKYGTVRALIKLPNVTGAWSAFWLFGKNGMPEHDIIEHCGEWENEVAVTHHWGYDYEENRGKKSTINNGRYNKNFKPTDNYYLYEVELTPYKVTYRINGIKVRTLTKHLSSGENVIIFDVTRGKYCGNKALARNAKMEISFLEIWKIQ